MFLDVSGSSQVSLSAIVFCVYIPSFFLIMAAEEPQLDEIRQPGTRSDGDSWGSQSEAEDAGYQQLINDSDDEDDEVTCRAAIEPEVAAAETAAEAEQAAAEEHAERVLALLEQSLQFMEADYAATLAMERRISVADVAVPVEAALEDDFDQEESDGCLAAPLDKPSLPTVHTEPMAAAAKPVRVAPLLAPPSGAPRPELDAALEALLQHMSPAGGPVPATSDT